MDLAALDLFCQQNVSCFQMVCPQGGTVDAQELQSSRLSRGPLILCDSEIDSRFNVVMFNFEVATVTGTWSFANIYPY